MQDSNLRGFSGPCCFRDSCHKPLGESAGAEDGVVETHPANGATRFPGGDRALAASSSTEESGEIESHGVSRALVSSEAQDPA
jgi:hypothetical protein